MSVFKCRRCKSFAAQVGKRTAILSPAGYCSWTCYEGRERRVKTSRPLDPEAPAAVLADLREHLLEVHQSTDVTAWFDCETCEKLSGRYAAALQEAV